MDPGHVPCPSCGAAVPAYYRVNSHCSDCHEPLYPPPRLRPWPFFRVEEEPAPIVLRPPVTIRPQANALPRMLPGRG
jgi:hypothetical protein